MFTIKQSCSLLAFLRKQTDLSGKEIKRMLEQGACRVNGVIERFASTQLQKGDKVSFHPSPTASQETMTILYEDPDLFIYNKPSGIPTKGNHLVHRLDKGTSGVLLVARNASMQKKLEALFKKREIKKAYIALVKGVLRKEQGVIENKLAKKGTFHGQSIWGSSPNGSLAITHWKCLKKGKGVSLVELQPLTGRTHQLRVHLSEMGHPILGDLQYGRNVAFPKEVNRLCLHAYRLSFIHPKTGKRLQATAPVPRLFKALCPN